jgi:transposase-like protein
VNSHQVFQWRRAYRNGELVLGHGSSATLLPVLLSSECATPAMPHDQEVQESEVETSTQDQTAAVSAAIHIELPGRALISVDGGADPILVRTILESLRK